MAMLHSAGAALAAAAAPGYQITDLGVVAGYENSFAYGLSDSGRQVAGWVDNGSTTQAFVWSAATGMQLLGNSTGATASRGFAVNDQGMVVGETSFGPQREATAWTGSTPSGLGSLSNAGSSVAFGVNDAGKVVGWSDSTDGTRAFVWESGSGMSSLGVLPGGTQTRAYNINASGQAVGWGTTPTGDRGFAAAPAMSAIPTLSATRRAHARLRQLESKRLGHRRCARPHAGRCGLHLVARRWHGFTGSLDRRHAQLRRRCQQ
jgi:probable HAF family extracellular repeat protein